MKEQGVRGGGWLGWTSVLSKGSLWLSAAEVSSSSSGLPHRTELKWRDFSTTLAIIETWIHVWQFFNSTASVLFSFITEKEPKDPPLTSIEPRLSELKDNPDNIKLGIIIGCTISAFCIVVLLLFIVWRNPCRLVSFFILTGKMRLLYGWCSQLYGIV